MRLGFVGLVVFAALAGAACAPVQDGTRRRQALAAATRQVLPWGAGPGAVGLRAAVAGHPPFGPSAVAVAPDGAPLVLDRLNRRVLRLDDGGRSPRVVAQVPEDAEDLAAGADGTLALFSPWRARVWIHDGGDPRELAVPRLLREVRGVALGPSRQVLLDTAYQETYSLGSPSAPQPEAGIFGQRREGAVLLADGRGVAVHLLADGRPELLARRAGERLDAAARTALPERVLAARVVGAAGPTACLRLEQAAPGPGFVVARRLVCLDVDTGARRLERALPPPGLYLPRRELAVGGAPARVAFLRADEGGLTVETFALGGAR